MTVGRASVPAARWPYKQLTDRTSAGLEHLKLATCACAAPPVATGYPAMMNARFTTPSTISVTIAPSGLLATVYAIAQAKHPTAAIQLIARRRDRQLPLRAAS